MPFARGCDPARSFPTEIRACPTLPRAPASQSFYSFHSTWFFRLTREFFLEAPQNKLKWSPASMWPTRCCALQDGKQLVDFYNCFDQPIPDLPCKADRNFFRSGKETPVKVAKRAAARLGYQAETWEVPWWSAG